MIALSAGCDLVSDRGQFSFADPNFVSDPLGPLVAPVQGRAVLEQSRFCPSDVYWLGDGSMDLDDSFEGGAIFDGCFEQAVIGQGHLDESGCVVFDRPGAVMWALASQTCPDLAPSMFRGSSADALVDDGVMFDVVPEDGVEARLSSTWDRLMLLGHPGPTGHFPHDFVEPSNEPTWVLAHQLHTRSIELYQPGSERAVGFSRDRAETHMVPHGDDVQMLVSDPARPELHRFRLAPGEAVAGEVYLQERELRTPLAIGVEPRLVRDLDVVVSYLPPSPGEERWGPPKYARAVARDDAGRAVRGTPVTWEVLEGRLALAVGRPQDGITPDYATLEDACTPPPEQPETRRAVLRARWAGRSDTIELSWTAFPNPELETFAPHPLCQGPEADGAEAGLGCRMGDGDDSMRWSLWLVVLAVARRRPRPSES